MSPWVEPDPREIWALQIAVATEVLGLAQVRPRAQVLRDRWHEALERARGWVEADGG